MFEDPEKNKTNKKQNKQILKHDVKVKIKISLYPLLGNPASNQVYKHYCYTK